MSTAKTNQGRTIHLYLDPYPSPKTFQCRRNTRLAFKTTSLPSTHQIFLHQPTLDLTHIHQDAIAPFTSIGSLDQPSSSFSSPRAAAHVLQQAITSDLCLPTRKIPTFSSLITTLHTGTILAGKMSSAKMNSMSASGTMPGDAAMLECTRLR